MGFFYFVRFLNLNYVKRFKPIYTNNLYNINKVKYWDGKSTDKERKWEDLKNKACREVFYEEPVPNNNTKL